MKKLKKFTAVLSVILLTAASIPIMTGCGSDSGQEYAWVLATASPEDTVTGLYAIKFAEEVDRLSGGEMKIQVYHNSTLGGDTELLESVQCGDIPFLVQNTAPEVSYLPRLCLFDLPCAFDNLDQLHEVLDDETFMTKVNEIYEEGGVRLLAMADQNFRVMTGNVRIESLNDAELYVGLEQHTVDAQENPYEVIVSNKFYEVQNYVVETNHLPHLLALVTGNDFYNSLEPEQQAIIDEAADIAKEYAREQAVERSESRIQEIVSGGGDPTKAAEIVTISDDLRAQMREKSSGLYEQIRKVVDDDDLFYTYIREEK